MSSDIEKEPLSRQQKKSKETKARIFHAAKTILQKQGYDQLSIKNICDEAGVSNGSFFHHFKTKDDLLSYYIEEQPSIFRRIQKIRIDAWLFFNIIRKKIILRLKVVIKASIRNTGFLTDILDR